MADFNPKQKTDWLGLVTLFTVVAHAIIEFVFGG